MDLKSGTAGGIVGLLVGLVVGGAWFASGDQGPEPAPEAAPAPEPRVVADRPTRPRGPAVDAGACADALAVALETITELERELYGTPIAWSDDTSPDHRPEAVQARVRQVFEDCAIDADLAGFDCDESPCYAIVTGGEGFAVYNQVVDCPTWNEAWGHTTGVATRVVDCGDGVRRNLMLVTPGARRASDEEIEAALSGPPPTPEEKASNENYAKRTKVRGDAAEERLCASVAAGQP